MKRTGDRPMVIHLKKKAAFHVKGMSKAGGKAAGKYRTSAAGHAGLSARIIRKDSMRKMAERTPEKQDVSADAGGFRHEKHTAPHSSQYLQDSRMPLSGSGQPVKIYRQSSGNHGYFFNGSRDISGGKACESLQDKETGYQKQGGSVLQQHQAGQAAQRTAGRKDSFAGAAAAAGAKTAFRQMEGGDEFYDACMTADILAAPVKSAADSGRDLYRRQAAQKAEKRIKKVRPGDAVSKKEASVEKRTAKAEPVPKSAGTVPGIRIHRKMSVPGISSTVSEFHKPVSGVPSTASVKKAGTGGQERKDFQTVVETGAGTSKAAAGTGNFKMVSASETGDFYTASAADTVLHAADKLKIKISSTLGMTGSRNFKTVSAAEAISGTADTADRKLPGTAGRSGMGLPCTPASGRKSVKAGSGLKTDISAPAAAPEKGVLNFSAGMEAKIPETVAAPGTGISRTPEKKPEIKFSGKKTDIHMPEKTLKQKNPAAAEKTGRTAAGTTGRKKKDSTVGRPAGRGTAGRGRKNSVRSRMIQLFISRQRQEENRDSTGRALKEIVMLNFSAVMKHAARYAGLFLAGMFLLTALLSFPVMAVLAVIYNSPFAICFPSISSAETTQQVLSAYMEEFYRDVEAELDDTAGYDRSERVYVNFTGDGIPDNYCDILAVYMVKYGNGDTATDMTDRAGQNFKSVFDDMCSYTISAGTETAEDEEGNETVSTVKYVNVELKTWQDMTSVYGFHEDEQEMLVELMKPENTALMGYSGTGGGQQESPGQQILPEQYQAAVDAVSDENGKKVLEFALSKVGYPYSQALRDSGTHFDCSSLAFYAWQNAGVNISYQGSTTAASEAQLCYDSSWLVHYDEMKPGDLIFYSYHKNGRFMDISHVAVYAGNGMAVEAANTRLGVVYRTVAGKDSIVMIGRPGQEAGR